MRQNRDKVTLFGLFMPTYIDMMLRLLTIFINIYMISKIDVNLVGAMGAGNQVFSLFTTICNFLAIGCSVVVAQAIGAKKELLAIRATHTSITLNAIVGLVCGSLVFFFTDGILELLQVPNESLNDSYNYLHIISITFIIDAIAIVTATIIRVYNHATSMMTIAISMNVVTLIINYLVLFEPFGLPYLGLKGVAYSTIIGRIFGIVLIFFVLIKIVKIPLYLKLFFRCRLTTIQKILFIGAPSAAENLLWMGQYMVAFSFVASMGKESLTVQTIYFYISSAIFFLSTSLSIANEVIVARLVGKGKLQAAYLRGLKSLKIGVIATIFLVFLVFLAKDFIMQELSLDENLKSIMLPLFVISLFLEPSRALNIIMVNSLRASGDAKFPFAMGIIFMWGVSIPLGWFLGIYLGYGIVGVWLGFCADEFLRGLANTVRWRSKKWQSKRLL